MNFKQNIFTLNYECREQINGYNFRFVNKKSLYVGAEVVFFNGSNAEVYYGPNNEILRDKEGIAHFVEHLLFTKKKANKNMLQILTSEKLNFNGATGQNVTYYYVHELKEKFLTNALYQLQEVAFTLDTDEEVVAKEHGVVGTESRLNSDSPYTIYSNQRAKYLQNTALDHVVIGDINSIESITLEDALKFYKDVYSLNNCEIVFYGSFEDDKQLKDQVVTQFMKNMETLHENYEIVAQKEGNKRIGVLPTRANYPGAKEVVYSPKVTNPSFYRSYMVNFDEVKCHINEKFAKLNIEFGFNLLNAQITKKLKDIFIANNVDYSKVSIDASSYKEQNCGIEFSITYDDSNVEELKHVIEVIKEVFKDIENIVTKQDFETYKQYLEMTEKKNLDKTTNEIMNTVAQAVSVNSNVFSIDELSQLTLEDKQRATNYEEFVNFVKNVDLDKNYIEFEFTNKEK